MNTKNETTVKAIVILAIIIAVTLLIINIPRKHQHIDSQLDASNSHVETAPREPNTPDQPASGDFDASDIEE